MAIALVAHTHVNGANGGTTSPGIDTTGASLLVIHTAQYGPFAQTTVSDSKGNTWTGLTAKAGSSETYSRIFYVANPTVGSGHTFTISKTSCSAELAAMAFSGISTTLPFLSESNNAGTNTALTSGSLVLQNGNLAIAGVCMGIASAGDTYSINSSYSIADQKTYIAGTSEGGAAAYLVSTSTLTSSPTWSVAHSSEIAATMAQFRSVISDFALFVHPGMSGGMRG